MSKKPKWNYAIVRSIFGDLWVGRTHLPLEDNRIYATFKEATEIAIGMTDSISNRDELKSEKDSKDNIITKDIESKIVRNL